MGNVSERQMISYMATVLKRDPKNLNSMYIGHIAYGDPRRKYRINDVPSDMLDTCLITPMDTKAEIVAAAMSYSGGEQQVISILRMREIAKTAGVPEPTVGNPQCLPNGAKLYRRNLRSAMIAGYSPDGSDVRKWTARVSY